MREMVRKWTRRTTMTVTKDDGDDNNSRVSNKTDDQRLYDSRYVLYHSNVVDRKNHKKQTTDFCMTLFRSKKVF